MSHVGLRCADLRTEGQAPQAHQGDSPFPLRRYAGHPLANGPGVRSPKFRLTLWVGLLWLAASCYQARPNPDDGGGPGPKDGTSAGGPSGPGGGGANAGDDPGPSTIRRLNRTEYNYSVRDLLGDTSQPASTFPPDNVVNTFDNTADVLTVPPVLAEGYVEAAERLARTALSTASAARSQILTCDPAATDHDACARQIIGAFAKRAFRRPAASDEVDRLLALEKLAEQNGDSFAAGIQLAIQAILTDPNFLFRVELDPDPASNTTHGVGPYELASRLSYFIYASMPDDPLFAAADAGDLVDPAKLEAQVRRMLADPKADGLSRSFGGQWLYTRALESARPSRDVYPNFNEDLRAAMETETALFFREFVSGDSDYRAMLDAPFTYVNGPLAALYGIAGVSGDAFQRVSLSGTPRQGLLTHASILAATSAPTRSSIPLRGKFILSELLCAPPPDPPPGTPQLSTTPMPGLTGRQELIAVTSANATCNSCHAQLNPLGFGLEHFDGIGAYRDEDNGQPIDTTGMLPDGTTFDGAAQEAQVIKNNPALTACVTKMMFTYALGRETTAADQPRLAAIAADVAAKGNRLSDLVVRIARDGAFLNRRGGVN